MSASRSESSRPRTNASASATDRRGQVGDADPADGDTEHDRLEPLSLAGGAGHLTHVLLDLLADVVGVGLGVPAQQRGDDPLDVGLVRALAAVPVGVGDVDASVDAVQDAVLHLLGQVTPGRRRVTAEVADGGAQQLLVVVGLRAGPPRQHHPVVHRQVVVAEDELGSTVSWVPRPEQRSQAP
jgi:hypothetical protein